MACVQDRAGGGNGVVLELARKRIRLVLASIGGRLDSRRKAGHVKSSVNRLDGWYALIPSRFQLSSASLD